MITVRVNDAGMRDLLARARAVKANPSPILRAMGNTLKSITEGTFNSAGAKFRPIPWVSKRDGTPSNLQASTTLAKSFFITVDKTKAVVGTPIKYAAIHQFGAVIRPKNPGGALRFFSGGRWWIVKRVTIPARPFFPIDGSEGVTTFTPAALTLMLRAGERALARQMGASTT